MAAAEGATAEWGVVADSIHIYTDRVDMNANLLVEGDSDLEGALDVDGVSNLDTTDIDGSLNVLQMSTFQANVQINDSLNVTNDAHIGGNFQVDMDSDLDGDLDVDGVSNLDTTDIDGSLNVLQMATFQANVQINDSLNVTNDAHIGGNFQVDGNSDLDGNLDVDGVSNLDTTDIDGSLNVLQMSTFQANVQINDSLNVTNDAHIGGNFQVDMDSDLDGDLDVDGVSNLDTTDIDGSLNVLQMATFQANVQINDSLNVTNDAHIGGNFQVDMDSDLDGDLDVDGVSNLDTTDIDGSLNVLQMSTFQANVQINDSLNVTNDARISGDFYVDGNSDLDGTLDVDGDTEMDTVNIDGSLTVAQFADFNDSLDVAKSVNIQDNLDVNDSLALNTAENQGTVFSVTDSKGGTGVSIVTVDIDGGASSATTLTTHRLIVQDDAVYNGDMTISGALAVTNNVTSSAVPTSPNNLTNKQYVDDAIAAAITPPQVFDYDVTSSTNTDTVYYINGDLLMYATMESGQENYEITVFGSDLGDVTGATLRARGESLDLYGGNEMWTAAGDGASATFNISYSAIVAQLGGQTDGYISTHLVFTTATATYQSGMTIRFYLDSTNAVASGSTFTDPE